MMKTKTNAIKIPKVTALCTAVSLAMLSAPTHANTTPSHKTIGDLEIYRAAEAGNATITMMLDRSGSMADQDGLPCPSRVPGLLTYHLRDEKNNIINSFTREDGTVVDSSKGIRVFLPYCSTPWTRFDRLKKAMMDLVHQEGLLSNSTKLGIGTFPTFVNWYTGSIFIPAKPLTREHRWDIMRYIATMSMNGGTPSAQAYVEAGAYMLGTTTARLSNTEEQRLATVGLAQIVNGTSLQILPCSTASMMSLAFGSGFSNPVPRNLSYNGQNFSWYFCNDGSNRMSFGTIGFDMSTQSGAAQATIIPNRLDKLDFNLLPEFDYAYGDSSINSKIWPLRPLTNNSVPRTDTFWKNSYNQYAEHYHFGKLIRYRKPSVNNSGFPFSYSSTKKPDGLTYQSPVSPGACDGYGIYFLTDGEPNNANTDALDSAMYSLNRTTRYTPTVSKGDFPDGTTYGQGGYWNMIASYSLNLKNGDNPLGVSIKTATVGFGKTFTPSVMPMTKKTVNGKEIDVVDCARLGTVDAQNLCKWGERGYGYGDGGFLATSDAKAVTQSVINFAATLDNTIPASPAGSISIPKDPLSVNSIQPYAYLPMLQPEVGKNLATWEGNLKKYDTINGTLYGQNNTRLYVNNPSATSSNGNFPFALNGAAMDSWQQTANANNASVAVGGTRSRLAIPTTSNRTNIRSVYVEVAGNLIKVGTNGRTLTGFNNLTGYSLIDKAYILNFLGFNVPVDDATYAAAPYDTLRSDEAKLESALAGASTHSKAMLGGVVHSVPVLAAYQGVINATTGNIDPVRSRSDYLLYGSMDGALHMVDATTGAENFAFIPRAIFANEQQRSALKIDSPSAQKGQPSFGVDAPWQIRAEYNFDNNTMKAKEMYAYGGLRMGGVGFYGLNLKNKDNPTLAFSINNSVAGFENMGQTWAKPLVATIRVKNPAGGKQAVSRSVLFVSGGYDMCYEDPKFKLNNPNASNVDTSCANKPTAKGNAIYMLDAKTGQLLQTWTNVGGNGDDRQHIKHSIVSEVAGLDRNNNGDVDSIYFSDLGGQIFRIDLAEGASATGSDLTRRVVRVFNANDNYDAATLPYRFYEKPEISFYDYEAGRIALVNIASGDRSSPLHTHRELNNANRVYGIIDRDLATAAITSTTGVGSMVSRNLTSANLVFHNTANITTGSSQKAAIDDMKSGKRHGWYYEMNRFDGSAGVKNLKSIGAGVVMGSVYYANIYSPDYAYSKGGSCSARIEGGTERQLYCLPWGVCTNSNGVVTNVSSNGTLGYIKAGPGIQEMALATITDTKDKSTNIRGLIGLDTIQERKDRVNTGYTGGSGSPWANDNQPAGGPGGDNIAGDFVVRTDQVLQVERWYDLQTAEKQ